MPCSRTQHGLTRVGLEPSTSGSGVRGIDHFLAHLSRRLSGELIGYPRSGVRPSSVVVRPFTFSNIFSSETAWPIKAKFYVESPWEGGTKVCINGPGHMTKMAAMPIYGKNLKNLLLQNRRADFHETWYVASGTPTHHSLYK